MLAPHIPFDQEESPLSFAAFLAETHTGGRLVRSGHRGNLPLTHALHVLPGNASRQIEI